MENLVNNFSGIYKDKRVFITGHSGFKGSWLAYWLTQMGAKVCGYSLKPPTSPNHFDLLNLNIESIIGDINDELFLSKCLTNFNPDIVFHLAAQPLVRLSYQEPKNTFVTNIIGSLNVYEAIRSCPNVKALVSITTDKVYDNKEWTWGYRENDPLGGKDPYSASKAAMEILTASYRHSFFNLEKYGRDHHCLMVTARAGNVIGGGDWATDRLIPDIIKATIKNEQVIIRSPKSVRPWQHVLEPLSGYLLLGQYLLEGKKQYAQEYNFGPKSTDEMNVEEVVVQIQKIWNKIKYKIEKPKIEFHEAALLRLDISRANNELGWRPLWDAKIALTKTIEWYQSYYDQNVVQTKNDLLSFIECAKKEKAPWIQS